MERTLILTPTLTLALASDPDPNILTLTLTPTLTLKPTPYPLPPTPYPLPPPLTLAPTLYLQGVLQQAQRYATPVAAASDSLPFAEQIQQVGQP